MPRKQVTIKSKPAGRMSLLRWFFVPDIEQGYGKWALRAMLWTIGFVIALWLLVATGLNNQAQQMGMPPMEFWATSKQLLGIAMNAWHQSLITVVVLYVMGVFMFMPRKTLDRESFVAATWTSTFWMAIFGSIIMFLHYNNIQTRLVFVVAILTLMSLTGIFAAATGFVRKIGLSRILTLAMFPFGITFIGFCGYFLPFKSNDKTIVVKYKWYQKLIDFALNTINGKISLMIIILLFSMISASPWELFMVAFFGGLYAWKKSGWMLANIKNLAVTIAIMNISIISALAYFLLNWK